MYFVYAIGELMLGKKTRETPHHHKEFSIRKHENPDCRKREPLKTIIVKRVDLEGLNGKVTVQSILNHIKYKQKILEALSQTVQRLI